ncbi:MAG: glycoside hydrolase family 15 protein [Verrucomicrobiae bacterium]|nr:glycoside hydrolase family 15 protein [Verrucomicrobiae bacterium]
MIEENYTQGVIGNGRSCALVEFDSTISFACLPDFDSGTVFASLIDKENGGSNRVSMVDGRVTAQAYEPRTNILVTTFESADGGHAFQITDFMPRYTWDGKAGSSGDAASDIVRVLHPLRGRPVVRIHHDARPEYARFPAKTTLDGTNNSIKTSTIGVLANGHEVYESIFLYTDLPKDAILESQQIQLNRSHYLLISYHDKVVPPDSELIDLMLQRTRAYWLLWSQRTHRPARYGDAVLRSALALKLLQFDHTGALVAAATTSLPETIGEERNWDYRFCWIRDASMTVSTLRRIGHPRMASRFIDWMLRTVPTKDDNLQIMYGLRGERELTEDTLDHLSGYQGSKPVRIGNAAYFQEQHDIYGILLDVVYQDVEARTRTPERLDQVWTRVRSVVRTVTQRWQEPDRGIWEIRGEARHFVFSKVLCWVAIDRALKIAKLLGKDAWYVLHAPLAEEIHLDICKKGWSDEVQAFTQTFGSSDLDASNLLLAHYGFISPRDPRFISTVEQSEKSLCQDGLMYRYRNQDDFGEPSSAFTVCSFWMVKALAAIGRQKDARAMFENLLACANVHGLYAEDLDFKTHRQLGNFPQAYSHLALIDCALDLEGDFEGHEEELTIDP